MSTQKIKPNVYEGNFIYDIVGELLIIQFFDFSDYPEKYNESDFRMMVRLETGVYTSEVHIYENRITTRECEKYDIGFLPIRMFVASFQQQYYMLSH